MMSEEPMPWFHRLRRMAAPIDGWVAEVWNPMTKEWQSAPGEPYWKPEHFEAARRWIELSNIEQAERNADIGRLGLGFSAGT